MTTPFDPIKALREELSGLTETLRTITAQVHHWESALSEAEAQHNAMKKTEGFLRGLIDAHRTKLRALESEAERKAKGE